MSDETKIIQKAALGSDTTQIGEQNNYYGMTAEEASNLAIKLFMDNFPRLQEEAKKIAKERAEELCKDIVDKLEKQGKTNFSEFSDPDIQYILNKSRFLSVVESENDRSKNRITSDRNKLIGNDRKSIVYLP